MVASRELGTRVVFRWYLLESESIHRGRGETSDARVFFGKLLYEESMPQEQARRTTPYQRFFNVRGHFKRPSALAAE